MQETTQNTEVQNGGKGWKIAGAIAIAALVGWNVYLMNKVDDIEISSQSERAAMTDLPCSLVQRATISHFSARFHGGTGTRGRRWPIRGRNRSKSAWRGNVPRWGFWAGSAAPRTCASSTRRSL